MKTLHFASGSYLVIKNHVGQYSFLFRSTEKPRLNWDGGKYEMLQHMDRLSKEIERAQRQVAALTAFLDGDSECSPEALR